MEALQIEAQTRDTAVSARSLRRSRIIPAVYYGKGQKSQPLQVSYQQFRKVFLKAGSNKVIDLNINGKKTKVLVHDVQYYPLTNAISHIDFLNVKLSEEVTTRVPVELTGMAPAVKDLGGIITTVKRDVTVRCLPMDIPSVIIVDVSTLVDFSCAVHVKDLTLPKGVKIIDNLDDVAVTVTAPRKEEEVAPAAPVTGIEGTAAEAAAQEEAAKVAEVAAGPEVEGGAKAKEEKK